MLKAIEKAYNEHDVGVYFILSNLFLKEYGISVEEPYILSYLDKTTSREIPKFIDGHSGSKETSSMVKDFPELVDIDLAIKLKSSKTTLEQYFIWMEEGGERAREVTPLGYFGDPSKIDIEAAQEREDNMVRDYSDLIEVFLQGNYVAPEF